MLSHGKDTKNPELRPTEIKSLVRFIYRGLIAGNPKDVYKRESELFGDSENNASRMRISIKANLQEEDKKNIKIVSHKNFAASHIRAGFPFSIYVRSLYDEKMHSFFEKLLTLSLWLGGIGQRSRRARGCIEIKSYEGAINSIPCTVNLNAAEFIHYLFKLINDPDIAPGKYEVRPGNIISIKRFPPEVNYPYIQKIEIGKAYQGFERLFEAIDKASHQVNLAGGSVYTGYGGGQKRMASSVYVSAVRLSDGIHPVCITLNPVFIDENMKRQMDKRDAFKTMFM